MGNRKILLREKTVETFVKNTATSKPVTLSNQISGFLVTPTSTGAAYGLTLLHKVSLQVL